MALGMSDRGTFPHPRFWRRCAGPRVGELHRCDWSPSGSGRDSICPDPGRPHFLAFPRDLLKGQRGHDPGDHLRRTLRAQHQFLGLGALNIRTPPGHRVRAPSRARIAEVRRENRPAGPLRLCSFPYTNRGSSTVQRHHTTLNRSPPAFRAQGGGARSWGGGGSCRSWLGRAATKERLVLKPPHGHPLSGGDPSQRRQHGGAVAAAEQRHHR